MPDAPTEKQIARAEKRILEGQTWDEFCDGLKRAGQFITREKGPSSAFDRAEGYRYLSRIARAALQTFVEHNDPLAPVLQRVVHETAKMGSDNPDNYYQNAAISGSESYRVWGTRGTVYYLGFGTQVGDYGGGRGMPPTGYVEAEDLTIEEDGTFELFISCEDPGGGKNWLPMKPESGTLIVRQTFLDREGEQRAELNIERLGAANTPSPVTPFSIDYGLTKSAMLVNGAAMLFSHWAEGFMEHVNELPQFDPVVSRNAGGDPNIVYYHSYWQLAPDEALVIEVTPPDCPFWNFQLNNHWMESLDYRYFPIHVNKHSATLEDDGSVRVVVAHQDLGFKNYIDTVAHDRGTMCWRWIRAEDNPQPQCRVVKLDALAVELGLPAPKPKPKPETEPAAGGADT